MSHDDCLLEEWLFPNKNVLTSIKRAVLSVTRDQRGMRHICKALRALFQSKKCAFASINDSELEHTRKKQRKSSGIKKKMYYGSSSASPSEMVGTPAPHSNQGPIVCRICPNRTRSSASVPGHRGAKAKVDIERKPPTPAAPAPGSCRRRR